MLYSCAACSTDIQPDRYRRSRHPPCQARHHRLLPDTYGEKAAYCWITHLNENMGLLWAILFSDGSNSIFKRALGTLFGQYLLVGSVKVKSAHSEVALLDIHSK